MQGVSDDEVTMQNKKFTGQLPKLDSIASTAHATRVDSIALTALATKDINFFKHHSTLETGRIQKNGNQDLYQLLNKRPANKTNQGMFYDRKK